jgi:PTH1 family peptidyl-tRNA hydrolase
MKLVVGLGNPGPRYEAHRHNIGFRVVEAMAAEAGLSLVPGRFEGRYAEGRWRGLEIGLLLPDTFMNASGRSVATALAELPVESAARDLLVVFDDADLPFGRLRLRATGSDGGHRGLRDILAATDSGVPRLRFGIGRPASGQDTKAFVLDSFSEAEEADLERHIPRATEAIATAFLDGFGKAMSVFNAPPEGDDDSAELAGPAKGPTAG